MPEGGGVFPVPSRRDWEVRAREELGGRDAAVLARRLPEGIETSVLSTRADLPAGEDPSGFPGFPPCLRGFRAVAAPPRVWSRLDAPEPGAAAEEAARDLAGGADGVWLVLERAARRGAAPADEAFEADLGAGGTALHDAAALREVLARLPDGAALALDAGAAALPAAAALLAALRDLGRDAAAPALFLGADPLGSVARDGTPPAALEELWREAARLAAHCLGELPGARALLVSSLPYHEGGAHAALELALAVATGIDSLRRLEREGLEPGAAASQLVFRLAAGTDLFVEAAKLRALRGLWCRVLEVAEAVPAASAPWVHAVASPRALARRDPGVNLLRATGSLFAALIGGADSVTALPFDAAAGPPTPLARRLARTVPRVLLEEGRLGWVTDPAGGSFAVESLTRRVAERAWAIVREIEAAGGMARCLASGDVRRRVEESWAERRRRLERRDPALVGVSEFVGPEGEPAGARPDVGPRPAPPAGRPQGAGGRGGGPLPRLPAEVEALVAAARRGASLGALRAALPGAGRGEAAEPFPRRRDAALFEDGEAGELVEAGGRPAARARPEGEGS